MIKTNSLRPDTAPGEEVAVQITDKRGYANRWMHSTRAVDNWLAEGLPHLKIGKRRVRILIPEADDWMRERFGQQCK